MNCNVCQAVLDSIPLHQNFGGTCLLCMARLGDPDAKADLLGAIRFRDHTIGEVIKMLSLCDDPHTERLVRWLRRAEAFDSLTREVRISITNHERRAHVS